VGDERFVVWFSDPATQDAALVGGKVAGLGGMLRQGVRVPPGFAVSTDGFRRFLAASGLDRRLEGAAESLADLPPLAAQLQDSVTSAPFPPDLGQAVDSAYDTLADQLRVQDPPVAVRSSATSEDSAVASFAGEYESFLWVRGAEAVRDAVQRCWASVFSHRALAYAVEHGISPLAVRVAVGVQKMVRARAAGVLFTLNPTTGDPSRVAIEGSWGLGSAVVGGEVTPDRFIVDKVTLRIVDRRVWPKPTQHVPAAAGGVLVSNVPAELQAIACLSDEEVLELARLGKRLHEWHGRAQDVEWAIDQDVAFPESVFLLQCRPETVWSRRAEQRPLPAADSPMAWIVQTLTRPH
jgi:pyruvate, water dikinase